jgi:O-antigen/teichoic acid export membrane protein
VYSVYFGLKLLLFVLDWSQRYAALELISDAIFFATLLVLALVAPTAGVLTFSVAYVFFIIVASRLIRQHGSTTEGLPAGREMLSYTAWSSVATYASVTLFALTVALTGAIAGSVAAGRIAALLAILMPFFLLSHSAAVLTFADVARARAAANDAGASVRGMCRVSAWFSAVAIPTCCLFAAEVIDVVLGASYRSATSGFFVLLICLAPTITAQPAAQALSAQGAVVGNATWSVAGMVVLVVGLVLLVPAHGVLGAAVACGLAMLVTSISVLVRAHLLFNLRLQDVAGAAVAVALGLVATQLYEAPLAARATLELTLLAAAAFALRRILRPRRAVDLTEHPLSVNETNVLR